MRRSRYVPLALLVGVSALATACDRGPLSDPVDDYSALDAPALLSACAVAPEASASAVIGLLGGTISAGGVTMTVPPGAVLGATEFNIHVPASPYAEVEIHADGQDHFQFLAPVVIAMGYSRCSTSGPLTAWHIDPDTRSFLENMGGVNDAANRRVIFSTLHLSGYAIAN
jgi:hypothetical protein